MIFRSILDSLSPFERVQAVSSLASLVKVQPGLDGLAKIAGGRQIMLAIEKLGGDHAKALTMWFGRFEDANEGQLTSH